MSQGVFIQLFSTIKDTFYRVSFPYKERNKAKNKVTINKEIFTHTVVAASQQ